MIVYFLIDLTKNYEELQVEKLNIPIRKLKANVFSQLFCLFFKLKK